MSDEIKKPQTAQEPADIERDLARSAWFDKVFAAWFAPFANRIVLFNAARGEEYFRRCGEFVKQHKVSPGECGDLPSAILSPAALGWFKSFDFEKLPGGRPCKPTTWQIEKARKYLASRHNKLLAEQLEESERLRHEGQEDRADRIAADARKFFSSFSDSAVPCTRAMDDIDGLVALAEATPPLFTLDGEMGRLLNSRLKPDNLGVILGDQKIGKTTDLVSLAVRAAKSVPTLFISTGDETKLKVDARVTTHLSFCATQPEYAKTEAVPVPDCAHNANGTCPIGMSGTPRQVKDWKCLISDGATPCELAEGAADGSRAIDGALYQPCCRCFPMNDGTQEDRERRRRWKSAVWWRTLTVPLADRKMIQSTRDRFEMDNPNGGLKVASYSAGELSVEGIWDLLETLDRTENFVPRVIVLDYADLLKQEIVRDTEKDHDGMRRIWEGLRGIPFKLHNLLITATQTNGESDGMETMTKRTIGRSKKAGDNCTWMATLNQTIAERRAKVKRVSILFAREGAFDPEHQALCCQWQEVQDGFAFSMPIFCKTKTEPRRER